MELNDKVFEVLRNFMEYGNYQGKPANAVKAIRKSFPDITQQACTDLFNACCLAYKDAVILVKENNLHYAKNSKDPLEAEQLFRKAHALVPEEILNWTIGWIYHWYYER